MKPGGLCFIDFKTKEDIFARKCCLISHLYMTVMKE